MEKPLFPSWSPFVRQPDSTPNTDPWTYDHPGFVEGTTNPQSKEEVAAANLAQIAGLARDTNLDAQAVDMNQANDWADEPSKGGLSYGPKNTGDSTTGGDY